MFRIVFMFLVLMCLVISAPDFVAAAPTDTSASVREVLSWPTLNRLWRALSSFWREEGCTIDPSGRCGGKLGSGQDENGCTIDPSGRCREPFEILGGDNGCTIDPDGRCRG